MIPQVHGTHFLGLLPYVKLRRSPKGFYGRVGDWGIFMQERQRDLEDPINSYSLLEGPVSTKWQMFERYRLREIINSDTGETVLLGLTGTGFLLGLKQPQGLYGDWQLYHCLVIPFKWRNP